MQQLQSERNALEADRRSARQQMLASTGEVSRAQQSLTEHQQDSERAMTQVEELRTELQNNHAVRPPLSLTFRLFLYARVSTGPSIDA